VEWITAALAAFALIVPVELPDKTFVATLVLATKYPPLPCGSGKPTSSCSAASRRGRAGVALLPAPGAARRGGPVLVGAIVLFVGAQIPPGGRKGSSSEERIKTPAPAARGRGSFGVLFAAEWGGLSQLLTAGLVASTGPGVHQTWLGLLWSRARGCCFGLGCWCGTWRSPCWPRRVAGVRARSAAVCGSPAFRPDFGPLFGVGPTSAGPADVHGWW
jgi:putative Ca2+/H+ antiporter (TMEM165/GDT1 family)